MPAEPSEVLVDFINKNCELPENMDVFASDGHIVLQFKDKSLATVLFSMNEGVNISKCVRDRVKDLKEARDTFRKNDLENMRKVLNQ